MSSDIEIYNQFYSTFGKAGMRQALDGFTVDYKHFGQVHGRHREIVVRRMKNALNHEMSLTNHRRVMSKDGERVERVWVSKDGREKPISRMDDDHLHNTILFIDRMMADGYWHLGRNADLPALLEEMEAERIRRNLPLPLVPIKSLAFRKGEMK